MLDPLGEVPAVPEGTVPLGSDETITGGSGIESGKNTLTASRVTSGGHTSGNNTLQNEHPPEALNKKALDIIHRYQCTTPIFRFHRVSNNSPNYLLDCS